MEPTLVTIPAPLRAATDELASAITMSPAFDDYRVAEERLAADPVASALLEQFMDAQRQIRARQASDTLTQDEISAYHELEAQVDANVLIRRYGAAQQRARATLPVVNQTISTLLGIDFAKLARRSSCC
ncbi:MAG: YlbF family regulator [Chloroflexales bacterium]